MSDLNERMRDLLGIPPRTVLARRSAIIAELRQFFCERNYLEVEPPAVVPAPGMEIHIQALEVASEGRVAYLHTSPEFAMKKLLAAGFEKVFAVGKVFRAGELGERHNPEFTMLEWYQAGMTAAALMVETEALVHRVAARHAEPSVAALLSVPFARLSLATAFASLGIDFEDLAVGDAEAFAAAARRAGVRIPPQEPFDDVFNRVMLERIEPRLSGPVFVHDYPIELAVLAQRQPSRPRFAERFELFFGPLELCNGFGELTDAAEQRARLLAEQGERRARGLAAYPLDEDFLTALEAMPNAAGNALGVDRLVMLLLGARALSEVIPFAAGRLFR